MEKQNGKGITLIALVITIIVLLILAGISISTLTGQNGILNKSSIAKEETKKAQYLEELKVIGLGLQPDRNLNNWDNQKYMNEYENEIRRDLMFHEAKEIKQLPHTEKITIQVITLEGWVYWVTEDGVEFKGLEEDLEPIQPEEPVVEPTGIWTSLEGNTLRFYTTEEKARSGGGKVYGNVQGIEFVRDNNAETIDTPWFADRNQITAVEFVDEVAPEYLAYYFSDLTSLETVDMEKVKTINVTNMYGLFLNCRNLKEINTKGFDTRNVENMGWMFLNCSSLTNLDVTMFDTRKVTNMEVLFSGCNSLTELDVSHFDTSNVTTMRSMFANCSKLTQINVSNFDTKNVTNMATMFFKCKALIKLDLSNLDVGNVTTMQQIFADCNSLEILDLSNFNSEKVSDMSGLFRDCNSLVTLDLSNFNTKNVTNMNSMFNGLSNLTNLDLSGFRTDYVTNMASMFLNSTKLNTLDLSSFNTTNVTDMSNMFSGCENLQNVNVSNFNTSKVDDFAYMFFGCKNLKELDLRNFVIKPTASLQQLFDICPLEKLDIRQIDLTNHTGNKYASFFGITTDAEITTNSNMKTWLNQNYPKFTNILTIN